MIKSNFSIKLDSTLDPIYTAKSGEKLRVETINAYGDNFKDMAQLMDLIQGKYGDKHHHPLTGPIDIDGAKPGDVLKVKIKSIDIEIAAQALSKSAGISPIEVNRFGDRAPVIANYHQMKNQMKYMNGMFIDYKPMLGIIGTAPAEGFIKTGHASNTGGNLDIPFITEGSTVYLPVEVYDGKLFLGDAHAAQGYGELGGIALEASAEVIIEVEILKPKQEFKEIVVVGTEPFSSKTALGVVGVSKNYQSLNEAVYNSYEGTANILQQLFPTIKRGYIYNLITAIGNSMNGQAFSKTSESTCIINILERSIQMLMKDSGFSLRNDLDTILFKQI